AGFGPGRRVRDWRRRLLDRRCWGVGGCWRGFSVRVRSTFSSFVTSGAGRFSDYPVSLGAGRGQAPDGQVVGVRRARPGMAPTGAVPHWRSRPRRALVRQSLENALQVGSAHRFDEVRVGPVSEGALSGGCLTLEGAD